MSIFSTMESSSFLILFLALGWLEGTELNQSIELPGVDLPLRIAQFICSISISDWYGLSVSQQQS